MHETYTVFVGTTMLSSGSLEQVLSEMKPQFDRDRGTLFLVFSDQTGRQVDFDLRGTLEEVLERVSPGRQRTGPGRPKLGVVAREVTLLPRHWEWLEQQSSGASAALRRLIDEARKNEPDTQRQRRLTDATARFLTAMAGNLPGYEEATRALYGRNSERFHELIRDWPQDVRTHTRRLVDGLL